MVRPLFNKSDFYFVLQKSGEKAKKLFAIIGQ